MPSSSKKCPECGAGKRFKDRSPATFDFKKPGDVGFSEKDAGAGMFKAQPPAKKKGETCPVCGTQMLFKERVNSWYCPECRSFY